MIRLLLFLSFFALPSALLAWDPDDETFDPTIFETVIDGASRIGDPSPFYREGYDERGFTVVNFTKQEGGNSTVNLAFLMLPRADDPAKLLGGSLYISPETAEALAGALVKGADLKKAHSINKGGWMGDWTLTYEAEKGLIFKQEKDGQSARFFLSVPAATKLAGALNHSVQSLRKAE
ncbi:MAG: hypothetical protein P1U87_16405 [Verrucomicrobiales bacterium]|nr:hypothetical protein [Verrucomicrobiales bacterium]